MFRARAYHGMTVTTQVAVTMISRLLRQSNILFPDLFLNTCIHVKHFLEGTKHQSQQPFISEPLEFGFPGVAHL